MKSKRIFSILLLLIAFSPVVDAENLPRQVTDQKSISDITRDFEKGISKLGIFMTLDCSKVIEVNRSIGAFCSFSTDDGNRTIMLCDDMMVGKLTIKVYGFGISDDALVEFTKNNCPLGG